MLILILTRDLVFPSRLRGVAELAGAQSLIVGSADEVLAALSHPGTPLVLLDLNTSSVDPATLVPQVRAAANPPRAVVAFGPHVHTDRLQAARDAGCDEVLTRGQFDAQIERLVSQYAVGQAERS